MRLDMAGMVAGVEAARRRRFHKNNSSERRPSFCLYATNHEFILNSSLQREKAIEHDALYDESRLDTAAREAKKRLDERLKSQTKTKRHSSSDECVKNRAGSEWAKWKGNGSNRLSWLRLGFGLGRRLWEEEECAVCLEALKSRCRGGGGTLMQLACGHRFHTDCLLPWLERNAHCPCCRMPTDLFIKK